MKSTTATCFCGCGLGWLVGAERWLDSTNEHGWLVTDALSSPEADLGREEMVELRDADAERFLAAGHEFRNGLEDAMHRPRRRGEYDLAGVRAWLREAEYHRTVLSEVRDRTPLHESARKALGEVRMARWMGPWMEREGLSVDEAARELGRRVNTGEPLPWDEMESELFFEMSFDPHEPPTVNARSSAEDLLMRTEAIFIELGASGPLGLLLQKVALKSMCDIAEEHPQYGVLLAVTLFGYAMRMARAEQAPLPEYEIFAVERWPVRDDAGTVDHDEMGKNPDVLAHLLQHTAALADDRLRLLRLLRLPLEVWFRFNLIAGKQLHRNLRRNGVKRRLRPGDDVMELLIRLGCAVRIVEEVANESPMPASAVGS